jgi:hypothetical protein
MSATQSWFGREATKFRSTRAGAGLASLSRRVVVTPERRRLAPTSLAARISRAMRLRLRPRFSPPGLSAACTRGAPYVSRELAWTVRICFSSAAPPRRQTLLGEYRARGKDDPPVTRFWSDPDLSGGTEGLQTFRWREMDSNF